MLAVLTQHCKGWVSIASRKFLYFYLRIPKFAIASLNASDTLGSVTDIEALQNQYKLAAIVKFVFNFDSFLDRETLNPLRLDSKLPSRPHVLVRRGRCRQPKST